MDPLISPFNQLTSEQYLSAGAKGSTLAQLYQAGYPVPDGFVVLPAAFTGDDLTPEAWGEVQNHLARLRANDLQLAFAVRSSALAEDSAQASFAGEFESVLNVCKDEDIQAAIHSVRASRFNNRVRAYSQARGLELEHEIAVIVQRLVPAELSGVLFTADPISGNRHKMTGNYAHGIGEALVSGEAEHKSFTLERPKGRYSGPSCLKRFAKQLYELGVRLERDLDGPQDIEWAIKAGTVYVLQSRPITTLQRANTVTGEYNDSLSGDFIWSSVNYGEAVSAVMSPLTWSIMRMSFSELDTIPGYSSVGNIGGRLYQNVSVMAATFRALGRNFKDLVIEMGGLRREDASRLNEYLMPLQGATFLTILPKAIRMQRKQRAVMKNLDAFVVSNPVWCADMRRRIQVARNSKELISLLDTLLSYSLEAFWRTVATALRYGELVAPLRSELLERVDASDADALLSNVSHPDGMLESLGPMVGIMRVARGEMTRQIYLEKWGHRGLLEAEISEPRPAEDPEWIERQLATIASSPVDVDRMLAIRRNDFQAAWQRFQSRYPRRVNSIRRNLARAAKAACQREAVRSESIRLLWVVRTWAQRAGEKTGLRDEVFFLSIEELVELLEGGRAPTEYIPARRETYERYRALPPYPRVIRGHFDPFLWSKDHERRMDIFDSHGILTGQIVEAQDENVILGIPGSAGRVEGLVRCLNNPEDGSHLKPGEILVAPQTNIGWTLIFPLAAAIITDVGAPLSHAAIVARELGIPAVLNCNSATTRLHTGDRVRVDGERGIVEVLS